ncbi:GPI inositol-deacylase [Aphelenchoides besseyi]|nr:GPI inositol-deacylase [Aphelenchoides besseyi]
MFFYPKSFFESVVVLAILIGTLLHFRNSFHNSLGRNDCEMTYMWRQMAFMDVGFKPNDRYSLFLYGEGLYAQKFLNTHYVDGLPIIFVPGNAGSGKQVRSLATVLQNKTESRATKFHFDVFAVDFNEEFSALHSSYLLNHTRFLHDAIEHVWKMYAKKPPGIVLFGHSLGGIVSRLVLEDSEIEKKISLIFTIATPFKEPPYPIDKMILRLWRQVHALNSTVPVISVDGGLRDELIAPEWTHAPFAQHSTTAEIDDVWVETDHRSIVWCNQFVRQNSRFLFDYARHLKTFREDFESLFVKHFKNANQYGSPTIVTNSSTLAFIEPGQCNPQCPTEGILKWNVEFNNRILVVISNVYTQQLTLNETIVGNYHKCGNSRLCLVYQNEPNDAILDLKYKNVWVFDEQINKRLTLSAYDGLFYLESIWTSFDFIGFKNVPLVFSNPFFVYKITVNSTEPLESVAFVTPQYRRVATRVNGSVEWKLRAFIEDQFVYSYLEFFGRKNAKVDIRVSLDVVYTLLKLLRTTRELILPFLVITFSPLILDELLRYERSIGRDLTILYCIYGFVPAITYVKFKTNDSMLTSFVFVVNIFIHLFVQSVSVIIDSINKITFKRWFSNRSNKLVRFSFLILQTLTFIGCPTHAFPPFFIAIMGFIFQHMNKQIYASNMTVNEGMGPTIQFLVLILLLQFPSGWEFGFGFVNYRQCEFSFTDFHIPAWAITILFVLWDCPQNWKTFPLVHRLCLFLLVIAAIVANNPTHFGSCLDDLSAICIAFAITLLISSKFVWLLKPDLRSSQLVCSTIMVLPLSLLKTAQNHPMLIELKNGETYNGVLISCDSWMNVHLRDAICTSKDGDKFMKIPEVYVRGATIKYLRIPEEVVDLVKEEVKQVRANQRDNRQAKKNFNRFQQQQRGGGGNASRGGGPRNQGNRLNQQRK